MNECVKGMSKEEVFMELAKDDMGKCNGCGHLKYNAFYGIMECKKMNETGGE